MIEGVGLKAEDFNTREFEFRHRIAPWAAMDYPYTVMKMLLVGGGDIGDTIPAPRF
jgi:hypothetical protein